MAGNHIKIHGGPRPYTIEVDGHPIQNVTEAVSLELSGRELPAVLLKLATYTVDADTTARIQLDPDAIEALRAIGWTPPPDDG